MNKLPTIVVGILVVMFFGFVAWKNIAPNGVEYVKDFSSPGEHAFVSDFTPGDRVEDFVTLVKDPVYFHVKAPRTFDEAGITFFGGDLHPIDLECASRAGGCLGDVNEVFSVAVQVGPSRDQFAMHGFETFDDEQIDIVIPLANAYRDNEGRYTFIMSFHDKIKNPTITHAAIKLYDK